VEHAASATRRGERSRIPCHNALRSPPSALNDLTEIPTLREVLCSPEIQREEPEER